MSNFPSCSLPPTLPRWRPPWSLGRSSAVAGHMTPYVWHAAWWAHCPSERWTCTALANQTHQPGGETARPANHKSRTTTGANEKQISKNVPWNYKKRMKNSSSQGLMPCWFLIFFLIYWLEGSHTFLVIQVFFISLWLKGLVQVFGCYKSFSCPLPLPLV